MGARKKDAPGRAYQPSGISLTRTQIPLSYRYLLMEDMLFAAVEGLCREQGDMAEITAGYLEGFYEKEMKAGGIKPV